LSAALRINRLSKIP